MKKLSVYEALSFLPLVQAGDGIAIKDGFKAKTKVFYIADTLDKVTLNDGNTILPATNKAVGYTNFDKGNTLNAGRNLLVTGVRIRFDTSTANVTPLIANWNSTAPTKIQNGEIEISQDGTPGFLLDGALGLFTKYNAAIPTEDEFVPIIPFMIREVSPFKIRMLLAAAGVATEAYRIEFLTVEFTQVSKA